MALDLYSAAIFSVALVLAGAIAIKTKISSSIFEVASGENFLEMIVPALRYVGIEFEAYSLFRDNRALAIALSEMIGVIIW